jgi:signal transduction histidine kinase
MQETSRTTLASIIFLDHNGVVVRGFGEGGSWKDIPEVRAALSGRPATVLRRNAAYHPRYSWEWLSRASALRIHHARPVVVNGQVEGVILVSRSPRALFRGIYQDFRVMADAIAVRSRYLRDFAAAVSHEFKTPLAGIQGAVELLQDHEDMEPARRRKFLDNIAADGRRLSGLVTRLMDLARADMARPEAGLSVDLRPPLLKSVDACSPGLNITLDLPGDLPPVAAPAATLEVVVSTMLENSRQAGARAVRIAARAAGDAVILSVSDDGPGVAPADARRIFEPFFTTRRSEGGAGLGLSIARALLAANQATLDLVPSEGGAVFEIGLLVAER